MVRKAVVTTTSNVDETISAPIVRQEDNRILSAKTIEAAERGISCIVCCDKIQCFSVGEMQSSWGLSCLFSTVTFDIWYFGMPTL